MMGERLRQARLVAGLTQDEVVIGLREFGVSLTKAGLSKYERGGSSPSAAMLLQLASVLGVRSSYFLDEPELSIRWLAFRKHAQLGRRSQQRVMATAAAIIERQIWLQERLYPRLRRVFPKPRKARFPEDAEAAAGRLREEWKLGVQPIENLTGTIEDHGGIVVECTGHREEFDGLSGWVNERYPLVVVSAAVPDDRRRFSLAHELGHLIMNCEGVDEKQEERLAHRFAAAFIVPSDVARHELGERRRHLDLQELVLLKRKHGLSMQAWMQRARDLGIIDEAHFKTLWRRFSARGWRKREPAEFEGKERPTRLRRMVLRALAEGIVTPATAEELYPGSTAEAAGPVRRRPSPYQSAVDVMRLPKTERDRILAEAAALAETEYDSNDQLTDFEAFGDEDLQDEST